MRIASRLSGIAVGVVAVAMASSCAPSEPPAPTPTSIVGMTMEEARAYLPETVLIYDLSQPVLGIEASYDQGKPQGHFTIVVQCEASNGFALGVLPTDDITDNIRVEATSGEFDNQLAECSAD